MNNEKGSALLLAFILSFLMMALGLALTITSLTEFSISDEFESHEKAVYIADAGLSGAVRELRGRDIDDLLGSVTLTPTYFTSGPVDSRNPINLQEARNIDFNRPPNSTGNYQTRGLVTSVAGEMLGRGRYFARISDNDDGDDDPFRDFDGKIFIRVVGTHPSPPQELVLYNSNLKNSVALIEALMKRDMSLDVGSPFSIYGPSVNPAKNNLFDGSSFTIDGYDHSGMTMDEILRGGHNHNNEESDQAALSVLNDDGNAGADSGALEDISDALTKNQADNLVGAEGPYGEDGPSIRDDTETVLGSDNQDATNVMNPDFLMDFVNRVASAADSRYTEDTSLSGSNIQLGTEENPEITVAEGNLSLSGGGFGSGILIVKGALDYSGAFDYNGLILVLGEGRVEFSGANKSIVGGIYTAKILEDEYGNRTFGIPEMTLSGNSNFYFRGKSIRMAISLLPMKMIGWREITREMVSSR